MEPNDALRLKAAEQLNSFLSDCGIEKYQDKKILEIGFKNGLFLDECRKAKLIPTGIEIKEEFYENVKHNLPDLDILLYDGNTFPFPDESFDFVVSFEVMEHVTSIERIFDECIRVLKPGGIMHHICPNYHSFYEGHYKIIWMPFLNKTLGRLYLKILRRYSQYYEHLNLVKPNNVKKALELHSGKIEIVSLGRNEFLRKFTPAQIEKVTQKTVKGFLKLIFRLPFAKNLCLKLISSLNLYYPVTIIAKKKDHD